MEVAVEGLQGFDDRIESVENLMYGRAGGGSHCVS
jgi:hypothetical protein